MALSPVERGLDVWMAGCFPLEVISILEGDISVTTVVMTHLKLGFKASLRLQSKT
jgi:hypothetical protein